MGSLWVILPDPFRMQIPCLLPPMSIRMVMVGLVEFTAVVRWSMGGMAGPSRLSRMNTQPARVASGRFPVQIMGNSPRSLAIGLLLNESGGDPPRARQDCGPEKASGGGPGSA
jgi:hypothetical protein